MTETLDNLSSLLDSNLDDIADLPEFGNFPAGVYTVEIKWEEKKINDKAAVELGMKLLSVEELADPTETPPSDGSQTSVLYFLDNEFGVGSLKATIKPLASHFGCASLRAAMEQSTGAQCLVTLSTKKSKKNPDQVFQGIKNIQVI